MAETDTPDALLTAAIQDLRAAADLLGERLGPIGRQVTDPGLCHALGELIVQARHASAALVATARGAGGPENVWMKGALDDATRDAERLMHRSVIMLVIENPVAPAIAPAIAFEQILHRLLRIAAADVDRVLVEH